MFVPCARLNMTRVISSYLRQIKPLQKQTSGQDQLSYAPEERLYQFDENLCERWIKMLPDIEIRDKFERGELEAKKTELRKQLMRESIIEKDDNILSKVRSSHPSCCAIDGARILERSKRGDLVLIGATRFNDKNSRSFHTNKNSIAFAEYTRHYELNHIIASAIMLRYELILGAKSLSKLVMFDGSLSSTILCTNIAASAKFVNSLTKEFEEKLYDFLLLLLNVLSGDQNKIYVSCPKSTEKQEIGYKMKWDRTYPDLLSSINEKELMNQIFDEGEFTTPQRLTSRAKVYNDNYSTLTNWNVFSTSLKKKDDRIHEVCEKLEDVPLDTVVCYYKPHKYSETIRIEFSKKIAEDENLMSELLATMKLYLPNNILIKEPILLYQADRQAKYQISSALRIYKTRLNWQNYRTDNDGGMGDDMKI